MSFVLASCSLTSSEGNSEKAEDTSSSFHTEYDWRISSSNLPLNPDIQTVLREEWTIDRTSEALTAFRASIPRHDGENAVEILGAASIDGRFEKLAKLHLFDTRNVALRTAEFENPLGSMADFEGYSKVIFWGPSGHLKETGERIYYRGYFNRERGIFCHGRMPGQVRCFWGNADLRMTVLFDTKDLPTVLPYLTEVTEDQPTAISDHNET